MSHQKSPKRLAKLLDYILARRPDEFGLVTDKDGFIKVKDLLKALSEEEGWRHVTRAGLNEIQLTLPKAPIEMIDNRIRAVDRRNLPYAATDQTPPKLLFTAVRRRAYARVIEKGVSPSLYPDVLLATERRMAERIGKRIDADPVLLTVNTHQAHQQQTFFKRYGADLFLAPFLRTRWRSSSSRAFFRFKL